jgi:single-strand DNA-binding protein
MNRLFILGNVGNDPEVRKFESNSSIANFSVAVTETTKDPNGDRIKTTEWFKCVTFNSLSLFVEKYVKKGSKVLIEGRIRTRSYKDKNGIDKTISEVLVDRLELLTWSESNNDNSF